MANYSLTFPEDEAGERKTIHFEALSLEAALRVAKTAGKGNRADLAEDDLPICTIDLVSDTGVWKITPHAGHVRQVG
ncbi:hypothetical protein OAS19_05025 [Altererythrobacter sp.]|nr:hypothetical protein [Altererythrobacter sp.]